MSQVRAPGFCALLFSAAPIVSWDRCDSNDDPRRKEPRDGLDPASTRLELRLGSALSRARPRLTREKRRQ